ncbi:MAG: tRNA (N(6)-L-threonylcarbamoyladenosine(37)-C(2))-methylthiotransferase MtaB [Prevotellaceae bacterium]|jgi:threonylcarbamoyladenosine tRNA methylthiotransferase MtaB|nr:tRNA (N(6)-L-threonylcarbamoyladenosine(37)-C(2))-methylthiotransferase MtaB [Prevotellaceae bacterium]
MNEKRKIAFCTLGCKLNFSETSMLARKFLENDFERVPSNQIADVYVVNTCSVTENADKKCRQLLRKLAKQAPQAIIVATGCYAQLKPQELAEIEGVDIVAGADMKGNIFEYVNSISEKKKAKIFSCEINETNSFFKAFSLGDRTRSFLKVQDGCDYNCAYCTIPMARGKSRNISIEEVCNEAKIIADSGVKEIIITGVNTGDFGKTTGELFIDLLKNLEKTEGIERYRISSIEPNLLTAEIIEFVKDSPKFLPHFHIPLQSGCDKILALMRRRYNTKLFAQRIRNIRQLMPDAFIGIDVIVGFPNETDDDFISTYNFLQEINPAFIHIFPYSDRANTATSTMQGKIANHIKTERVNKLKDLCETLHSNFYKNNIGQKANVLFEGARHGEMMSGFSGNYIKVEIPYQKDLVGKIVETEITAIAESGNAAGLVGNCKL